jgi:PAS domain S-box-containing protein
MDEHSRHANGDSVGSAEHSPPLVNHSIAQTIQGTAVNEALLIAGLREHALREKADVLAKELRGEMELRRSADELVRASEIRFRRIFETAESGIFILSALNLQIKDANPFFCRLVGYAREELVGKELWAAKLFEDEEPIRAAFLKLKDTGYIRDEDLPLQTKLGRTIHVGFVANLYDEVGVQVVQCNIRDVTESRHMLAVARAASAAAEKANSTKDLFLAALSHELRTPLNPVLLLASEGASNESLAAEVRDDFASIEKNVVLEAHLIDELLDFTKISRGKIALKINSVPLNEILRDAIGNIQYEIDKKRLKLEFKTLPRNPMVKGDALRLQQVLWNVLKNAIKFTENEGWILIETSIDPSKNTVVIAVSDSGIGIDPSELDRIFDPFEQGDHGKDGGSNKYGGLGLGLSIARNILELHSGTIKAESRGIGCGSVFTVELPMGSSFESSQCDAQTGGMAPAVAAEMRVRALVVEDDAESRTAMVRLLVAREIDVSSVENFGDALQAGSQQHFDLLITDIGLPDGNGLDLLELCAHKSPRIRGITISGYGMESDINLSKIAKFAVHLVKPVGIRALESALQVAMAAPSPFLEIFGGPVAPDSMHSIV